MNTRTALFATTGALGLLLSGCATTLKQTIEPDADKIAAFPLTHRAEVERIDIAQLIKDEANLDCKLTPRSLAALEETANVNFAGHRFDEALGCFNEFARKASYAAITRNQIQERLLAASEQRCADFKALLQRKQSDTNFFTGLATSAFAAAGSITKSVEGARTLAGLSGLSSAYGAEYNQAYFSNLASHVIVSGIDLHRSRIYEQITTRGQSKPINDYPLQAAIKDAFRYHAACSIMTGLVQAQEAIKTVENPGLGILQRATIRNKFLQALTKAEPAEVPKTLETWKDVIQSDSWLAGIPIVNSTATSPPEPARLAIQLQQLVASAKVTNAQLATYAASVSAGRVGAALVTESTAAINASTARFKALSDSLIATTSACDTKVVTKGSDSLKLIATIAATTDEIEREKLAIDAKFLDREVDAISAALTTRDFAVASCGRNLRAAIAEIASTPKTDEAKTKVANDVLTKVTASCPASVAALTECK